MPHDDDGAADPDDAVWKALANPTRRRLLDLLFEAPRPTGALVEATGLSRFVVMQHLGVLREADLVLVEVRGRQRMNHLNPVPIQRIHERWVSRYAEPWTAALVGLAHAAERAARGEERPEHDEQGASDVG